MGQLLPMVMDLLGVTPALSQVQLQPGSANLTTQSNVSVVPKNKEELNELLSKYYKLLLIPTS